MKEGREKRRIGGFRDIKGESNQDMLNISEILKQKSPKKFQKSQRAEITKEIYELYCSPTQDKLRKIENWKRYVKHCKENNLKIKDDTNVLRFKKNKLFIKCLLVKAFCFRISHIKTTDLFYCLSEAKDRDRRGQSIAKFLF